jgi:hypothetical protein
MVYKNATLRTKYYRKIVETPSILIIMSSQLDNKMGKTIKIPLCRNSAKVSSERYRNRGNTPLKHIYMTAHIPGLVQALL